MEEQKETLPFESKVQLIYDFWTLRKYLEKKEPEYKKQIQDLETEKNQYQINWERDKLNTSELNFLKNMCMHVHCALPICVWLSEWHFSFPQSYGRAMELENSRFFAMVESGNIFLMLGSHRKVSFFPP